LKFFIVPAFIQTCKFDTSKKTRSTLGLCANRREAVFIFATSAVKIINVAQPTAGPLRHEKNPGSTVGTGQQCSGRRRFSPHK